MRYATTPDGDYTGATDMPRDGDYICPVCATALILRHGPIRAPHFAHHPHSTCTWTAPPTGTGHHYLDDDDQLRLFDTDEEAPTATDAAPATTPTAGPLPPRCAPRGRLRAWWARHRRVVRARRWR